MTSEKCIWTEGNPNDYGEWETSCANADQLDGETPRAYGYRYCPFCGKEIIEKRWARKDE